MAATPQRFKLKQAPLDVWSVRERLSLACSVMRSGDQNWVSVSRAIRPFAERDRPNDWFSQKHCALQYSDLLEKVETPKRKRGERGEIETPGNQIVRNLSIERIEELKRLIQEEQQKYRKIKREVEAVKSGQCDDRIKDMWEECVEQRKAEEEARAAAKKKAEDESAARAAAAAQLKLNKPLIPGLKSPKKHQQKLKIGIIQKPNLSESEDTQDSVVSEGTNVDVTTDEEHPGSALAAALTGTTPHSTTASSLMLSSLLQSKHKSSEGLQHIKAEREESSELGVREEREAASRASTHDSNTSSSTDNKLDPTSPTTGPSTLSKLLGTPPAVPCKSTTTQMAAAVSQPVKDEPKAQSSAPAAQATVTPAATSKAAAPEPETEEVEVEESSIDITIAEVIENADQQISLDVLHDVDSPPPEDMDIVDPMPEEVEALLKEEPASPASSVSSHISDTNTRPSAKKRPKNKGRSSNRRSSARLTRSTVPGDEEEPTEEPSKADAKKESKESESKKEEKIEVEEKTPDPRLRLELDTSDDETVPESDDASLSTPKFNVPNLFSESIPNSPASMSQCSDTEDEKAYRTWKKSIMLVWRSAANHKYANVFLHPVTDDIAPGYRGIVHRPMDMSTIKKNVELGQIRTTSEFQRDMMLMFTNAIMYNNSNQNVYKMAKEMYDDVMEHIEQYVHTQLMLQSSEMKQLRTSRRSDASDKEEELKRRRTSIDQDAGGKVKKRKTRQDD